MYHELATKLFIPGNSSEVLQVIPMEGYNAACVDTTVFTGATVSVTLLCGNDSANWTTAGTTDTLAAGPIYEMTPHTQFGQIATRYVRVKVATTTATAAIVSLGINCTNIGA